MGFELRTDAWGAIRAAKGVLLSTYGQADAAPAGDNAAGLALGKQLATLSKSFSDAAKAHQATPLAAHIGSVQAAQSVISQQEAPVPALVTCLKGMVADASLDEAACDAAAKHTGTGEGKLPQVADPVVAVAARAGLGIVAGQDLQFSAGETLTLAAGQNLELASGGAMRIHTGQSIGVLAGAVKAGEKAAGKGITLVAGQGDISVQAQSDVLRVAAKHDVSVQSASAHVDWAAARKITLATAGGASIVIEGGNITVMCPGKIGVWAGRKSFSAAKNEPTQLPELPRHTMQCDERFQLVDATGDPLKNFRVEIVKPDGTATQVVSDANGMLPLQQGFSPEQLKLRVLSRAGWP